MRIINLAFVLLSLPAVAMEPHMDAMPLSQFSVQYLEQRFVGAQQSLAWELEGSYGNDQHKAVVKNSGSRSAGEQRLSSDTQLLYRRMASDFFDWQLGLRHTDQAGPERNYAVLGVNGLAPQWIELEANLFVSEQGKSALGFEAEHLTRFSQRWLLETKLEYALALNQDRALAQAAGSSDLELGLRLHYRINPQFSPYAGYLWEKHYRRSHDEPAQQGAWLVGLRFWL